MPNNGSGNEGGGGGEPGSSASVDSGAVLNQARRIISSLSDSVKEQLFEGWGMRQSDTELLKHLEKESKRQLARDEDKETEEVNFF